MSILYGVSVGPGDSRLLTLAAIDAMKKADIICYVGDRKEDCLAYRIAKGAWSEIDGKESIGLYFPMTKDIALLEKAHAESVTRIIELLELGKTVAFIVLGDVSLYSTYLYVDKQIRQKGYAVEMIAGVSSITAVAARVGIGLCEKKERLHVIPSSYALNKALELEGTLVLMKSGKEYARVVTELRDMHVQRDVYMVENCGLENERVFRGVDNLPSNSGYYTIIIIK